MASPINPAAVLEAALAARGIPTVGAEGALPGGVALPGATPPAAAGQPAAPPSPILLRPSPLPQPAGSETPPVLPALTPEQLQALAAANAAPPVPGAPVPVVAPGAPAPDPMLQRLTEKFGPEAAQLLLDQIKGTAALSKRVDSVLDRLAAPPPPAPFDALADPNVKFHSDQIATIDAELQEVEGRISASVQEAHGINAKLQKLIGARDALRGTELTDKLNATEAEISRLDRAYDAAKSQWTSADGDVRRLRREKMDATFKRDQAASTAKAIHQESIAAAIDAEDSERTNSAKTNADFDAACVKHAGRYGIQITPAIHSDLVDRFGRFVASLPREQRRDAINFDTFVGGQIDAMAVVWGITPRAEFTQHSREAAAAALLPRPPLPAPVTPPPPPSGWANLAPGEQAQGARAHARSVLIRRG